MNVTSIGLRRDTEHMADRYQRPGWFTKHVFNNIVAAFTRLGISVWGSRVLEVPGRKTGEPRRTPVNLLTYEGDRYLVAPRGHTNWVRNLRASGSGRLLLGRRRERVERALWCRHAVHEHGLIAAELLGEE